MFKRLNLTELLLKIRLSSVINLFLTLEKRENKFFSLCPFHTEQTPSFLVNDNDQEKGFYYCFGCKKTGDAINFLMEYKKMQFHDAVDFLIKHHNMSDDIPIIYKDKSKNIKYYIILKNAADFYCKNLKKNLVKNQELVNFLTLRGITDNLIDIFQIGFATDSWTDILKEFPRSNDRISLVELGLIIKKKNTLYDRFRHRLIFPIKNYNNDIVGFGGRILNNNKPKYINSPESTIFVKKNELYHLYKTDEDNLYTSVIVVEGYLDVISLYNHGIVNVVSSLGTSFSQEQFNILKKRYKKIIFCYDGDNAGQTALFKIAIKLLNSLSENLYIGFVILPVEHDPDSLIRSDKQFFIKLLDQPLFILDFIFVHLTKNININLIDKKIDLFYNLMSISRTIMDNGLRRLIINYFNDKIFKISETNIKYNNQKNDNTVLSLAMKGCIFLLKKRHLIKLLEHKDVCFLQKNNADVNLFIMLINILKYDINAVITPELKSQINTSNNLSMIIDNMNDDILKSEFMEIINKLEHIE